MKKTLFLIFSAAIVIFTIISICCAPIINGVLTESSGWKTENCQKESDYYKSLEDGDANDDTLKAQKKEINKCNRHKAMYGLEYSSLILDVVLGFICLILGLLHYFDVAKPFEKVTGIIGLATGICGFVLTLVYICYSCYIFTNEKAPNGYDDGFGDITGKEGFLLKMNDKGAFAKKDGSEYKCLYYKKGKEEPLLATYSDLGKKSYNYEKKRYYPGNDDEITGCTLTRNEAFDTCKNYKTFSLSLNSLITTITKDCKYIYISDKAKGFGNKYLFDRWITTIIFSCFIIVCCIGLAIFGFLLFKSDGSGI